MTSLEFGWDSRTYLLPVEVVVPGAVEPGAAAPGVVPDAGVVESAVPVALGAVFGAAAGAAS